MELLEVYVEIHLVSAYKRIHCKDENCCLSDICKKIIFYYIFTFLRRFSRCLCFLNYSSINSPRQFQMDELWYVLTKRYFDLHSHEFLSRDRRMGTSRGSNCYIVCNFYTANNPSILEHHRKQ